MRKNVLLPLIVILLSGLACFSIPSNLTTPQSPANLPETSAENTASILEHLGGVPCADSNFTCITLTVPLDHFNSANGTSINVVFAVLPASGKSKGLFVTAMGGHNHSGLAAADVYTSFFDPSIVENFDIVFFDQRGVGKSGGMQCVNAAAEFYRADWRTDTPERQAAFLEVARTFAQDCIKEMGLPIENLPFYSTKQAVEDLEDFRQAMGSKVLWLYGESYGTQYAQTYAAAYPEGLGGLILDGTDDLTLTGPQYYTGAVHAFYNDLIDILKSCSSDETCAPDFGGDALKFYQDFAAKLQASTQMVSFPLPSGGVEERPFSYSDLEQVVTLELYSEGSRQMLLRALAAAQRGDLVPLLRLLYSDLSLYPQTQAPIPKPDYSDAAYYVTVCNDYSYYDGPPDERVQAMLAEGAALAKSAPYLSSYFYTDIPCIFWPVQGEAERPAPLIAEGVTTLVLGATADPITPFQNGENVFNRLADGYLVTTKDGSHIIYGRGNDCPDEIVTAFLVEDKTPAKRKTTCDGELYTPYVPLAPLSAKAFSNPLEALSSVDDESMYLPEYYYWDYETPTDIGCPFGGTFSFEPSGIGEKYTLDNCAYSEGFVMTGNGSYDYDAGVFSLEVIVTRIANGELTYTHDQDNIRTVTGTYNGEPVNITK